MIFESGRQLCLGDPEYDFPRESPAFYEWLHRVFLKAAQEIRRAAALSDEALGRLDTAGSGRNGRRWEGKPVE